MYLVWLQAKRIQPYLLGSPKLRHMIGASELVEQSCGELVKNACTQLGSGKLLHGAAGQAWVEFSERAEGEAFLRLWPALLDAFAPGLRVFGGGIDYDRSASSEAKRDALDRLREQLRAAVNAPTTPAPELSPLVERAPSTGGGAVRVSKRGNDSRAPLLDLETSRKEDVFASKAPDLRLGADLTTPERFSWPRDFSDIAGDSEDLAVIHADGNGLGGLLRQLNDESRGADPLDTLIAFSKAVSKASLGAARTAVEQVLYPAVGRRGDIPARPLVLGGDDLTFVVRSDLSAPFVEAYLLAFEDQSRAAFEEVASGEGHFLTACAGIALVRANFPFLQAYELAETTCGWVKDRARGVCADDDPVPSALAFHRSTVSLVGSYEELLETELRGAPDAGAEGLLLTRGPYSVGGRVRCSLPSTTDLASLGKALKRLPRGAVRGVLGELRTSRENAQQRWARALEVAGEGDADEAKLAFERVTNGKALGNERRNPLLDAVTWDRMHPIPAEQEVAQ
jgi:hypothetical protein